MMTPLSENALDLVWLIAVVAITAFGIMGVDVLVERRVRSRGQLTVMVLSALVAVASCITLLVGPLTWE